MTARWMTRWKPAVGFESLHAVDDEIGELVVDIALEIAAQHVDIDAAGAHDGRRVLVVDQGEKQMLERRIFVAALIGDRERAMKRLLKTAGECRHRGSYSFSIVHCSGCWCLRAKSMTCVTLVSAISNV